MKLGNKINACHSTDFVEQKTKCGEVTGIFIKIHVFVYNLQPLEPPPKKTLIKRLFKKNAGTVLMF